MPRDPHRPSPGLGGRLKVKAQLWLGAEIAMGPGKAELLHWLDQTGSISAAARAMGLSYRRAWLMVDTMNRCFAKPLVETAHGGSKGGGAQLSQFGHETLAAYRKLAADLDIGFTEGSTALVGRLAKTPRLPG